MSFLWDLDHWREVFQSLRRNRLRTLLTACGVFWGVLMLVVMLGFSKGLENSVATAVGNWAQNAVFVWPEQTMRPFAGRQPGRVPQLTLDDADAVRARVPGVALVLPRIHVGGWQGSGTVSRKDKTESAGISGEMPEYLQLETMIMDRGRFLNPLDLAQTRKVAVIGARVRELLFPRDEDPIGQTIKMGAAELTVVGAYTSPAAGGRGDWANGRVFIPRTTYARIFGTGNRISYLALLVAPERSSVEVEREVKTLLKARHRVDREDAGGFGSFNRDKEFRKITNLFFAIQAITWVVGVLTLLAGAIGVSNIMMIAVAERTREIGIRKAIGATPFSIMAQIVQESVVLTALAGYLGLVAGVGVVEIAARIAAAMPRGDGPRFFVNPEVDLGRALVAAAILTIAGGLAGLAPARSAVAVRPVEALAHE